MKIAKKILADRDEKLLSTRLRLKLIINFYVSFSKCFKMNNLVEDTLKHLESGIYFALIGKGNFSERLENGNNFEFLKYVKYIFKF